VFVQCSPASAKNLIGKVQKDLSQKQIGTLKLTEEIDNLYDLVAQRSDYNNLNILFIEGLEKSLEPYIKAGYGGEGEYYTLNTVPKILSHLNQKRESFRDNFSNICFVLILPLFAIKFFIRRAPDFFDWSSGVFEFPDERNLLEQSYENLVLKSEYSSYINLTQQERIQKILSAWNNRGIALYDLGRYEEAVASYDKAIEIKPDDEEAWNNRGIALRNLGRYEEAVASYDKALEIKPDFETAWNNRGNALRNLGRYEEAVASYDKAIEIKPDDEEAWNNRGNALMNLGRYEEAVASYNKAIEIKPDYQDAWDGRGNALKNLGRN
jgi:tetratricopeptide (TPR) repeat protein